MNKKFLKTFFMFSLLIVFSLVTLFADDSRNYPVTATYCDGSKLDIYPYSYVSRTDGSTFNCYKANITSISNGYRYSFEDKDDNDYNDIIIELWISGNNTSSPKIHLKYISSDASYNHKIHIVYNSEDTFVFDADNSSPGITYDISLPEKPCPDFDLKVEPLSKTIIKGESAEYKINLTTENDFSDKVSLGIEGLPAETSAEFNPELIEYGETSILKINSNTPVNPGTYTLTVKGTSGSLVHTKDITLIIEELVCPDFEINIKSEPNKGYPPLEVSFEAEIKESEASHNNGYEYSWNFGDGNTSNKEDPVHTYLDSGNFKVILKINNSCGKEKTAEKIINILPFQGTITKYFSKKEAEPGESLNMTITVKNNTDKDFTDIIVWDNIPEGLIYQKDEADVQTEWSGNKVIWKFPLIKKKQKKKILVFLKVLPDFSEGEIINQAYLKHNSLENPIHSNKAILNVYKIEAELKKSVDKNTAEPGDLLRYTITFSNNSPKTLSHVKIKDTLPEQVQFISQASNWQFSKNGNKIKWIGSLKANSETSFIVEVRTKEQVRGGIKIENYATVEAEELKEKIISNSVYTNITSNPISTSDIIFRKNVDLPQTEVGRIVRFRLSIENKSNSVLFNPRVQDFLPQGFNYVEGTTILSSQKFFDPEGKRRLIWSLPDINRNERITLRFQTVIGSDARRGKNINRALLLCRDSSGQLIKIEASEFINVSSIGFEFFSGLEGIVFLDRNKDEFYSPSDTPLQDIEVRLSTGEKAFTNSEGRYSFEGLHSGSYAVGINTVTLPEKYELKTLSPQAAILTDGLTDTVDFAVVLSREDEQRPSRLEGRVFFDKTKNNKYDPGEPLLKDFRVTIDNSFSTKGESGKFVFSKLKNGEHKIIIKYKNKNYKKTIELKKGNNLIEFPLKFTGILITITEEGSK